MSNSEHETLVFHTEVRWLSKGRIRHSKKRKGYQEQLDRIIIGYAQEIKELRRKRDQSMEKSNQAINDDQPELEEVLHVNNNKDQEYTCLLYTSRCV